MSEKEEEKECRVRDPDTDECLDEKLQQALLSLPDKKKFKIKASGILGWRDIDGEGKTLPEAIGNEFDENYGRGGSSLLGKRIDEQMQSEIEEKEKELNRELTEQEISDLSEPILEFEANEFKYYLEGDLTKKQKQLMEDWGIQKAEVTEFYNDVYGRWMEVDDLQQVCDFCNYPLTKTDLVAGYCGQCGEGEFGTTFWHGKELKEFAEQMEEKGYSIQEVEELANDTEVYKEWRAGQEKIEKLKEEKWQDTEKIIQEKLKQQEIAKQKRKHK